MSANPAWLSADKQDYAARLVEVDRELATLSRETDLRSATEDERVEISRKRNALHSQRKYYRKKLRGASLEKEREILTLQNRRLRQENENLEKTLAWATEKVRLHQSLSMHKIVGFPSPETHRPVEEPLLREPLRQQQLPTLSQRDQGLHNHSILQISSNLAASVESSGRSPRPLGTARLPSLGATRDNSALDLSTSSRNALLSRVLAHSWESTSLSPLLDRNSVGGTNRPDPSAFLGIAQQGDSQHQETLQRLLIQRYRMKEELERLIRIQRQEIVHSLVAASIRTPFASQGVESTSRIIPSQDPSQHIMRPGLFNQNAPTIPSNEGNREAILLRTLLHRQQQETSTSRSLGEFMSSPIVANAALDEAREDDRKPAASNKSSHGN